MGLDFRTDPEFTPVLRDGVARLWNDVNNAGGAVGFVAPTTVEDVLPSLDRHAEQLAAGRTRLIVGLDDAGAPAAAAFLVLNDRGLTRHWAWLQTVMVHPKLERLGHGSALMRQSEALARAVGLAAIRLSYRGGLGLGRFYGSLGYTEVGRIPRALRVGSPAGEDDRDSVEMWLALD